jgi:DNA-binding response OmpR family regulator
LKNVAIEIISAIGIRENRRMGQLEPNIYDYLAKPIDINELISSVQKCTAYLYAKDQDSDL